METLSLLDQILADWKILVFAFGLGALYYQARIWFSKLTKALDTTGRVHGEQNIMLDNINQKLESLDRRTAKIEESIESIKLDNNQQSIKIAVLETQAEIIDHPIKRRPRRQQS
jgi:hypothetical protein